MTEETQPHEMASKRIVLELPDMKAVRVRKDIEIPSASSKTLALDVYSPLDTSLNADASARAPVVIFVSGYPDPGFRTIVGCALKDMGSYVSWAELLAVSGMVAVTYENTNPAEDIHTVLEYVTTHADELGVDPERVGVWAASGNVPNALSMLMSTGETIRCAALCYGYMLDLDGDTGVADASALFGFVNPALGRLVADIPAQLPIQITRAGCDETPNLNASIDRFVAAALEAGLQLTLIDHAAGVHAFDIEQDSDESRARIREIVDFLCSHLLEP